VVMRIISEQEQAFNSDDKIVKVYSMKDSGIAQWLKLLAQGRKIWSSSLSCDENEFFIKFIAPTGLRLRRPA